MENLIGKNPNEVQKTKRESSEKRDADSHSKSARRSAAKRRQEVPFYELILLRFQKIKISNPFQQE